MLEKKLTDATDDELEDIKEALATRESQLSMSMLHRSVSTALNEAREARDAADRSESGRHLAIITTELEKVLALVEFYELDQLIRAVAKE